jgi:hypothetical protein
MIIHPDNPAKYFIIFPTSTGAQVIQEESQLDFQEFCSFVDEKVKKGMLRFMVNTEQCFTFVVSPNQHFSYTIMTEKSFMQWQKEMQYQQAKAQGGMFSPSGRKI